MRIYSINTLYPMCLIEGLFSRHDDFSEHVESITKYAPISKIAMLGPDDRLWFQVNLALMARVARNRILNTNTRPLCGSND